MGLLLVKKVYWIPKEDTCCTGLITIDKKYEIHYDKDNNERYIYDDLGNNCNYFIVLDGEYIKI